MYFLAKRRTKSALSSRLQTVAIMTMALLSCNLSAREVDQYLAWGTDLEDSGEIIDHYLREGMREAIALEKVNQAHIPQTTEQPFDKNSAYQSCWATARSMMREAFYSPTYQKIEKFIETEDGIDIYPRRPTTEDADERLRLGQTPENGFMTNKEYLKSSIVGSSPFNVPFSRIVNAYGIYTGADKFGHFTSWGVRYLDQFAKQLKKGKSVEEAFNYVMHRGYKSERSVVGMMFTQVFSRGDLESNFQGMKFSYSLCEADSEVRLEFNSTENRWELLNLDKFTVKHYINPNWDESWHSSIFSEKAWQNKVIVQFEERALCEQLETPWVQNQRKFYANYSNTSLSIAYGDTWIEEHLDGLKPNDHSLESYCNSKDEQSAFAPPESGNPLRLEDNKWRYSIAFPMLWAPSINGKIRGEDRIDFEVTFRDILENLKLGIMFELYANKGPYGLAFRSNYMVVEDERSKSGSLSYSRINTSLDMGVNDLLASFRVHDKVRIVTGVRHVLAKLDLKLYSEVLGKEILNQKVNVTDDNQFDLLFGINFNHFFTPKWGVMLNSDLGVLGDNDRNFSTEFRALYHMSDLNNLWFGWRYLNIGNDVKANGETIKIDLSQTGPTLGWAFTF